ncbi:MAG: peroxiredoxin [Candidatus Melainabacteria bacterium]|nr:peroxiredoxin [Candidatus Melainabacteria bacterium]
MTALTVGDRLPDISLTGLDGQPVRLHDLLDSHLVLFFYPKDDTPGCTQEACSFRDMYDIFLRLGARVVGISADSVESHRRFSERHGLPFLLLSDPEHLARRALGVPNTLGFIPGRVTYVIDRDGVIRQVFNAQFHPQAHIDQALRILQSLAEPAEPLPDV